MINRLRPDLLEKAQDDPLEAMVVRKDVRNLDDNVHKSAKDILVEKGILRDPTKPTALLDQFTGTQPVKPERKLEKMATQET